MSLGIPSTHFELKPSLTRSRVVEFIGSSPLFPTRTLTLEFLNFGLRVEVVSTDIPLRFDSSRTVVVAEQSQVTRHSSPLSQVVHFYVILLGVIYGLGTRT